MAESSDFYRKSYERMLREFTRLEDHDLRLVKLFKLTVSRTLIAVEKAYPSLVPLCNRIRSHASRQADADFPLDRLQVDIEQLSQRLRELESGRDNAAPADEKPDNSRAEYQRKLFVREFIPQMLEGIAFIAPLESHRKQLLESIGAHQFDAHPSLLIDRTVALINEMRQMIEQEKTELTLFLDEIKSSVQKIEEDAFNQGKQAEERRGKLRRFDNMLGRTVGKLKKEIEQAEDIDTIKQTMRDQIEQLHDKVREFHETEGRRLAEFESQNLRLRGYLTTVIKRAQLHENKLKEKGADRNRCMLTALPNAFCLRAAAAYGTGAVAPWPAADLDAVCRHRSPQTDRQERRPTDRRQDPDRAGADDLPDDPLQRLLRPHRCGPVRHPVEGTGRLHGHGTGRGHPGARDAHAVAPCQQKPLVDPVLRLDRAGGRPDLRGGLSPRPRGPPTRQGSRRQPLPAGRSAIAKICTNPIPLCVP